jgi:hypothetical protein
MIVDSIATTVLDELNPRTIKSAQDLKCGDVFIFRESIYVSLSNHTDERHTVTISTCWKVSNPLISNKMEIASIVLFRTFKVTVVGQSSIILEKLSNKPEELTEGMVAELEAIRRNQ